MNQIHILIEAILVTVIILLVIRSNKKKNAHQSLPYSSYDREVKLTNSNLQQRQIADKLSAEIESYDQITTMQSESLANERDRRSTLENELSAALLTLESRERMLKEFCTLNSEFSDYVGFRRGLSTKNKNLLSRCEKLLNN